MHYIQKLDYDLRIKEGDWCRKPLQLNMLKQFLHKQLTIFWIARPRITFCKKIKASSSSSSNWKTTKEHLVRYLYMVNLIIFHIYLQLRPQWKRTSKIQFMTENTDGKETWNKRFAFFTWDGTWTDGVGGRGIGFSTFTKNLSGFSGSGGLLANSIAFATSSNSRWRRCFLFTNPPFPLDLGFGAWILGCVTKSGREASSSNRPW